MDVTVFLLLASAAIDPGTAARIEQSLAAGTGTTIARFADCHRSAVLYFFDGHHTPELIPDWLAWQQYAISKDALAISSLSEEGFTIVRAARSVVSDHLAQYELRAKEVYRAYKRGEVPSTERKRFANASADESEVLARKTLASIRENLSASDFAVLKSFLHRYRKTLVVNRVDFRKIGDYGACERNDGSQRR